MVIEFHILSSSNGNHIAYKYGNDLLNMLAFFLGISDTFPIVWHIIDNFGLWRSQWHIVLDIQLVCCCFRYQAAFPYLVLLLQCEWRTPSRLDQYWWWSSYWMAQTNISSAASRGLLFYLSCNYISRYYF